MRRPFPPLLLAGAVAAAALAACSPEVDAEAPASAPEPARTVLGGVDLSQPVRALGTEPFWSVDITSEALVYSGVDRPEQRAANPGPVLTGSVATYTAATAQGQALVVSLMATECSDGMSDRTYPLTARVEIGPEALSGCAASVAAIARSGESGAVQ